jgi:hypothetical protein
MNNIFYVYIYIDPRNNEPFYVGKGKGRRYKYHLNMAKSNLYHKESNGPKINKIRDILEVGMEPMIEIFRDLDENDSFRMEMDLISKYGRIDLGTGTLTNLSGGGEGQSGWIPDDDYRKRMSDSTRGEKNGMFGKNQSNETKEKIKNKALGREVSESTRKKMSEQRIGEMNGFFGKKHTNESLKTISINRKGKCKGSDNGSSKKFLFISPEGSNYIINGGFENFCNSNQLSVGRINRFINKGKIPECNKSHNMTTQLTINCFGWEVKII